MATKIDFTYKGQTKQAYKEGTLIIWPTDDGQWTVLHELTALSVCNKKQWKMKRDAMAYCQALIDYEENGVKIIWDFKNQDTFVQANGFDYLVRVWEKLKDM